MAVSIQGKLFLSEAQRYWELLRVFVERNLSARYRGSSLGIFWSLLNPVIMTGIYTAIFGSAFAEAFGSILNYALAALTALVIINFFSASTTQALTSVVANGALLNKIRLPISVFPTAAITANIFQLMVASVPLLVVITLVTSKSLLNVVALPLPLLSLILVSLGVGYLVSALYVFFRDLPYFYEIIVFVLWISSPVFYPAKIVPPQVKPFLAFNPLSAIIESTRQIVLSGQLPDFSLIFGTLLGSIIVFGLGLSLFRWWQPHFMDLL
ncbi:ABC transporter permease [Leptothermofonsia sp. ETS-13]|uniref:ABC transporter permease n=1 Tax=Leptothermofonsia sp. ETS-13 TaxID=3035696 RepID=UPI003BA1D0D4